MDGQDGARGPSDAFTKFVDVDTIIGSGDNAIVASLALPAGSFVLSGSALVSDSFPSQLGAQGTCGFEAVGWPGGVGTYDFDPQHRAIVTMNGAVTLADPGTVDLRCRNDGADDVVVRFARATAIQVATLTDQS